MLVSMLSTVRNAVFGVCILAAFPAAAGEVDGCSVFPGDNIWNTPVDTLPVDARSGDYVSAIGSDTGLHPDFGAGLWAGGPIGIPYITVTSAQPFVPVDFDYADESDPGPYPVPPDAPIEGGDGSDGDRHILALEKDSCILYELFSAYPHGSGWLAGSGAVFDLKSHALRPDGWTSADAAGLPILPGLVRYDEVLSGEIDHALRFTAPRTRKAYVWPARHHASSLTAPGLPPMGQRFRLKRDFNIAGFSPEVQVILRALKKYGMLLADNGSPWFISGAPDARWNNDVLRELKGITGTAFEAVDSSFLIIDRDSGRARQTPALAPLPVITVNGSEEPSTILPGEPVMVRISLAGRDAVGRDGDHWVAARTAKGWFHYDMTAGRWSPGLAASYQGKIVDMSGQTVLHRKLPAGLLPCTFYFAVDLDMNGIVDRGSISLDRVRVSAAPVPTVKVP